MAITLDVFTIGDGDLIQEVFNAVASFFNDPVGIKAVTSLAVLFGGLIATFEFIKSHDLRVLMRWIGMYVLVTSLILYPKATVNIEDRTGEDITPRFVDHVPLILGIIANITSSIGIGLTEMVETIFHMPNDMTYNKTGMLMGSKLILAAKNFQITDADFSQTLNEFMQQCVFYDILLKKYSVQDLVNASNPWEFIKAHTSVARAFPLNGQITICNEGATQLDAMWQKSINQAATVYGGQLLGKSNDPATLLISHLSDGYHFLTNASAEGTDIIKTNLIANAMSQALSHYSANSNAPAAMQAYEDTKTELQTRETMDQTGRQAAEWMQFCKNIIEAVIYAAFIIIYFLAYFPFGTAIFRNYVCGLFFIQSLAPMYAIINFAANFFAESRTIKFLSSNGSDGGSSIANIAGITQANADAMAVAGYLMWPVTLGGAYIFFTNLPGALQSMGQYLGGVAQNAGSHVVAEAVSGNISLGNTNFGNQSLSNMNANHWDTNARYASGGASLQTATGSTLSITPSGSEVLDNRGGLSNLGVSVNVAESTRMAASHQMQSSISAAISKNHAAGEQYGATFRTMSDYARQFSHSDSNGTSYSSTESSGLSRSAHSVSQIIDSFAKEHHVSHEKSAALFGQIYADMKGGVSLLGNEAGVGGSVSGSLSGRSSFGSSYNDAYRYAQDHNFAETVDSAKREAIESHARSNNDQGDRMASALASSFDKGDSYRTEAASLYSKAESYSSLASTAQENAASINANYTEEFYEWMRKQPAPSAQYGQGTWSKSAIDNAAVHHPATLQRYADRFVNEKTGQLLTSFEQSNHLTNAAQSLNAVSHQENQSIRGLAHVNDEFNRFDKVVHQRGESAHLGNQTSTNTAIQSNVNHAMQVNSTELQESKDRVLDHSIHLQEQVHSKVKGQILGSLGDVTPPKNMSTIKDSLKE